MEYGLQVADATGKLGLDSTKMVGWRLVDSFSVNVGASASKNYSATLPLGFTLVAIPTCTAGGACHRVTVSGYTVTAIMLANEITGNYATNYTKTIIMVFMR